VKRQTKQAVYTLLSDCSYTVLIVLPTVDKEIRVLGFGDEADVGAHYEIFQTFWKQMVGFRLRDHATATTPVFTGVDVCLLRSLSVSPQVTPPNILENCSESRLDSSLFIDIFCFSASCCCGANFEVFFAMQRRCPSNQFRRRIR
jgi:hypothetical protein